MSGPDLTVAEHQASVNPTPLDNLLQLRRQVGDRRRAARQTVEGLGQVLGQAAGIALERAHDVVQVGSLQLEDLVKPVHHLYVRVAPQFAERRGALDGLVAEAVELSK